MMQEETAVPSVRIADPSAAAISPILEMFRSSQRFLVTSHARPDGDAVGSVLAMGCVLEQMGCEVEMVLADPVPYIYRKLPGVERIRVKKTLGWEGQGFDCAADTVPVVILECDCTERTGLTGFEGRCVINIDHHASGQNFATLNWIDDDACAVASMVHRVAVAAGVEVTRDMATCLYTAVLSDTGSFTYPGTNAATFELAHELVLRGANPSAIAREVYFSNPESKIRLLGRALETMHTQDGVAWAWVTQDVMAEAAAETEDCEGVVNYLIGMDGVECAVFMREIEDRRNFRMSLRSKGRVNVAAIAEGFGGGGHRSASGCVLEGPLERAKGLIVGELSARLRERVLIG